ncbi:MAG: ferrous iron transport protein A [Defluviitaleaceae bacterium]|nr:ferrous iron transport protein A [Defluviitaleaceae bacterium]
MSPTTVNLYEARPRNALRVASVPDIGLLQGIGLRVGTRVVVQNRYTFGGPVVLKVEDAFCVAIGKDVATQIAVTEASS